ncbi:hypothetical protein K474DRAFT_1677936 [Panus rudis PR-1116 ss-1]|nr:hypothetical protein K474DRAFT_1677936 [Panus rudis PR-1116 ss-1]
MCFTAVPKREPCSVPYARAEKRTKIIPAREATRVPDDAMTYDTSHHPTHLRPHQHTISILRIAPSQLTSYKTEKEISRTYKTAVVEGVTKSLEATGQVFANVLTLYGESDQSGSEELRVLGSSWKALLKEFKVVASGVGQLIGRSKFDFACHVPKSPGNSDDHVQAKHLRAKLGHLRTGFVTILSLWHLFLASSSRHPDDINATMADFDSGVSSGLRQINETIEGRRRTMYE